MQDFTMSVCVAYEWKKTGLYSRICCLRSRQQSLMMAQNTIDGNKLMILVKHFGLANLHDSQVHVNISC